jgi:uncharacterized membrane protein
METVEKSVEVEAPLSSVYNQWTQFEQFPEFMEGVEEVQQTDDKHLHWKARVAGKEKEWDAEIVEQIPDQRIAWRSISGTRNAGTVRFFPLDASRTRVTLMMEYEPEGVMETLVDAFGVLSRRVEKDVEHFKRYIESRGAETGAWRGRISGKEVEPMEEPRSKRIRE